MADKSLLADVNASRAQAKHVRVTPMKARRLVDVIRGMQAEEALAVLKFAPQSASEPVYKVVASADIPRQPQAESLTMSMDRQSLLVGSEGKKSRVYSVAVPSEATPTPTPSEDPGSETDVPEDQADSIQNQKGTLLTLGLAGFVALVAGSVVALARRP